MLSQSQQNNHHFLCDATFVPTNWGPHVCPYNETNLFYECFWMLIVILFVVNLKWMNAFNRCFSDELTWYWVLIAITNLEASLSFEYL